MKRFYKQVSAAEVDGGWQVTLDGRGIKTQSGGQQVVPSRAAAEALAAEWDAQGDTIDPQHFRLRDMADYAIDVVAADRAAAITKLLGYAETDTLCYRADPEDALFKRQLEEWEPILTALEAREGVKLTRISGIVHREQPAQTLAALKARLESMDPFTLAGLEVLASLAASLCIGLSALEPNADHAALWRAASLEEEWQAELWGRDEEAEARRTKREADFLNAAEWLKLLRA